VVSFLFAGIALLVILPILYFLPLGFSLKGKSVIFVLSLVISLVGLIATPILQLWQIGLILLLFVSLAAYLLTNKIERFMEVPTEEDSELPLADQAVISENVNDAFSYIATSDTKQEETTEPEQIGIFAKAMRQAGEAKPSALFGNNQSVNDDNDFALFTEEVAVTREDVAKESNDKESESSYLADMEDLLVVEEKVDKPKPPTDKHEIAEISVDDVRSTPTRLQGNLSLGEDELAEVPGVDEIQVDEIESRPTAVLKSQEESEDFLAELDEIPEVVFDEKETKEPKKETELDEDFWNRLLEDDVLEVIDDKELEKVK
jgi:hypothetical protein